MKLFSVSLIVISISLTSAFAQSVFLTPDVSIPVLSGGDSLKYPWTGGFNSVIPVEMDLNGDGTHDVFLFDRIGNRITPFLNDGTAGTDAYDYAPEFAEHLPPLHDWVRSVDYDCDGDLDLFTYTNAAMGVWRNDFTPATGLQFTPITQQLSSWYGSFYTPIFVSQVNMPAIVDVDGDLDLDIITFANSSNYLEYHKNYAMDSLGICGDFRFTLEPYCWGYFKLSGLTNIGLLNQNCRSGFTADSLPEDQRNRHSGSVLTPMDQDCDGDIDLLNGDILGENMLFLLNGGTPDSAHITSQDSAFPSYDVSVNMQNLPAAYYMDLDNDGLKDMLVSPYATVGEDFDNLHFYKNTSDNCSNVFSLNSTRFISDQTIDLGTAANVAFFDADADGLNDIIAGNDLYFSPNPAIAYSRLAYFRNTGTVVQPSYTLVTDDWLSLSGITQYGLYPAFGDLDGDGDKDMLLGNADGTLIYYQNNAATGSAPNFVFASPQFQGIDVGSNSVPQIIDVNRDGKVDLLVGERSGNLNYYENTGSVQSPVFILTTSSFGNVNVTQAGAVAGYSVPLLFDNNGNYELLIGSDGGTIFHFTGIDGNLNGSFTLLDSSFQDILELKRVTIAMADVDGDGGYDLLTGCNAGGMRLYTRKSSTGVNSDVVFVNPLIYPNPAQSEITAILPTGSVRAEMSLIRILDLSGKIVAETSISAAQVKMDVSNLAPGIYHVRVNGKLAGAAKLIITR